MSKQQASVLTRQLTGATYSLVVRQRKQRWVWGLLVLCLLGAGGVYSHYSNHASPEVALRTTIDDLQRENQRLTQEVKQQTMNFQHEQAVRESLEKELASQGEALKQARKDLTFYRNNAARPGQ